ncbi:MAG: sigma-54 dependent transcriptional regulator [Desulfobacteraceae bacterium]|nr:sigma-54 dependent transcriptional regulator [Desulfobacteraceae bacterium]
MSDPADGRIMIIDDEPNGAKILSAILKGDGYKTSIFQSAKQALEMLPAANPHLIISDIMMPEMDGIAFFEALKSRQNEIPLIFLTGFGTIETAVSAMASGAYHFFVKPPNYQKLREVVGRVMGERCARVEQSRQAKTLTFEDGREIILGASPSMLHLLHTIDEVKDSAINVLITGETGTGKELIARMLHHRGCRQNEPFVALNCAAIPHELMESELFGSEKGSFTGSTSRRVGKFEEAAGGTVLLDEIGELPLSLQAKLLRVLQEREIERLGSNKRIKVDFRLLSSTNRDLKSKVQNGTFREDLYYRINVIHVEIPPLRDRVEDIPILIKTFVEEFSARERKNLVVTDEVVQMLQEYHWPGNIRQLKNAIERAVVLAKGRRITKNDFTGEFQGSSRSLRQLKQNLMPLKELEIEAVRQSLTVCKGNKSKASRLLGISRKALYKRLHDAELCMKKFRSHARSARL